MTMYALLTLKLQLSRVLLAAICRADMLVGSVVEQQTEFPGQQSVSS